MEKLCEKTISVIGLGVVGLTTAVGFALKGHSVIGIDVTPEKVMGIADGINPTYEKGLGKALKKVKLATSTDFEQVLNSDVSFLCVGTPGNANGSINSRPMQEAAEQLAEQLKGKKSPTLL